MGIADRGGATHQPGRKAYGKTAKKGAIWSVLRQGGHELIAIPTSMIMARLLSPADFGIAAAASFFILLASRLTQFGFNAAIVRVKELRPEHASSVFIVNLAMGVLCYTTLAASAPLIGRLFRSPETAELIPLAALTFLIVPFGAVPAALITRKMQFRYTALGDWMDGIIGSVATVILAWRGWGYWSIACGNVIGVATRITLLAYLSRWRPSLRFSRQAIHELLSFGLGLQAKRILEYASFNVDNLVVGRMLGMNALGLYDKAFSTMNRLVTRLTLGQAPFRIFAIIHEDGDRFRRAYSRLILGVTLMGYPAFAAAIVAAEPLFILLYGEKWLPAVLPFQLLCVGGTLKLLHAYASQANEAAGAIWGQVWRQGIGAVLIVVGAITGGMFWGVNGAALGVAVAMVILSGMMQSLVRRATGLSWSAMAAPHIPGLVCAVALSALMLAAELALREVVASPAAWLRLLTMGVAAAVFYAAFILFSPFTAVREIVKETVDDLAPPPAINAFHRLSRLGRASAP
jgi:PST family polysaccharide transporter